jgi:large-conductance mechanosensitive channel
MFLDTIFQFLIIAWSAFIVVRLMNRLIRDRSPAKEEAKS